MNTCNKHTMLAFDSSIEDVHILCINTYTLHTHNQKLHLKMKMYSRVKRGTHSFRPMGLWNQSKSYYGIERIIMEELELLSLNDAYSYAGHGIYILFHSTLRNKSPQSIDLQSFLDSAWLILPLPNNTAKSMLCGKRHFSDFYFSTWN